MLVERLKLGSLEHEHGRRHHGQATGHGELSGVHHHPELQPVRPDRRTLGHGCDGAHLRAADPVQPGRAAEVLPVAGHVLRVVQRRENPHLRDPPGREVERRPAVHAGRRGLHLQHAEGQRGGQPERREVRPSERVRQQRRAQLRDPAVQQPAVHRRHRNGAGAHLEVGRQPGHVRGPQPGRHRPDQAGQLHAAGFHPDQNPSYWQASQMQVPKVFFPVYTSNTSALSALFSGHIDWTGNYIPGLQHSFISTNPEFHHHWEAPGGTNSLVPNMNKWPTNQLPVRQAISAAINRQLLASEGESGLENPVLNATGLTPQLFDAWSGPVASMTVPATGDAAAAQQILQKAGYTKGSDGFFSKGGKKVSITITNPSAYTDYAQVDSLVAQQLKAAGIDASFQGQSVDAWNADVASGNFQLTSHWSNGGITPYNMYDGWLDSALS